MARNPTFIVAPRASPTHQVLPAKGHGEKRGFLVMEVDDFRRIALSLPGAEESSHMGQPDFRVGGRIFATLAAQHLGYGNLMLTPDEQADFVAEMPDVFLPVAGGWGRNGATHVRLATVTNDVLAGALRTAYNLRVVKNANSGKKTSRRKRPTRRS